MMTTDTPQAAEKPLLFSGLMVLQILADRKTQTRRLVPICDEPITQDDADACKRQRGIPTKAVNVRNGYGYLKCDAPKGSATVSSRVPWPCGYRGDRLWVREAWRTERKADACKPRELMKVHPIWYECDGTHGVLVNPSPQELKGRYRHARFMMRWMSRLTLEVQHTRVERLQDISEADALAEGVAFMWDIPDADETLTARQLYKILWESINGEGSWNLNPWVWVIDFTRLPLATTATTP
jgi:hypothetical protein